MWQRFTERARRVVFFAQEEVELHGENYVATEHLLLGLVRENDTVAALMFHRMGISLEQVRSEVERQTPRGDGRHGLDMQLTPRVKRVIDLSYEEARQRNTKYIGTEHLLLGLIREGEGLAGRVLSKLGVDLERARLELVAIQDAAAAEMLKGSSETTDASSVIEDAIRKRLEVLETARNSLKDRSGIEASSQEFSLTVPGDFGIFGDLGVVKAREGRTIVEITLDAASFTRLSDIFQAKDTLGYRAMAQGDQTMFLIPNGTPLKLLVPTAGSEAATEMGGCYVRVLSGVYEGYAGWMFSAAFDRTGADDAPFPPEIES